MMDSVIQFRGTIYENGYGLIAQKVMRDKRLPKQSKLIYAYMCSFAGIDKEGNRTAFPSVKLQCDELGMKDDTYYKWRKYLVEYGYITIEPQKNEKGQFERNLYIIEAVPVEKPVEEGTNEPYPKKPGTEKPYPKKPGTEKRGTNSNSSNSNIFEEEEEDITLGHVMSFLNEQIIKREITNQKTITAIFEVAAKCKAIGTTDRQSMENYCIKVIEEKMKLFGQKQGKRKPSKSTRTEPVPEWLGNESTDQHETSKDFEEKKRKMEERLKKKYKKKPYSVHSSDDDSLLDLNTKGRP